VLGLIFSDKYRWYLRGRCWGEHFDFGGGGDRGLELQDWGDQIEEHEMGDGYSA
jgi:hypothetical protein